MTMGARIPSLSANLGQACYTCFREENDGVTLSRCSACKRISYCGP
jgi:splicing suppressor protein 51